MAATGSPAAMASKRLKGSCSVIELRAKMSIRLKKWAGSCTCPRNCVRSAMPTHEARRRAPNAAFLSGRFDAYREASGHVMAALRRLSPLVEPLSLDEAFVDLRAATRPVSSRARRAAGSCASAASSTTT